VAKKKISPPDGSDILDVEQTAEYFGAGVRLIYKMAKDGSLPAFKFGDGCWRFNRSALVEWSKSQAFDNLTKREED